MLRTWSFSLAITSVQQTTGPTIHVHPHVSAFHSSCSSICSIYSVIPEFGKANFFLFLSVTQRIFPCFSRNSLPFGLYPPTHSFRLSTVQDRHPITSPIQNADKTCFAFLPHPCLALVQKDHCVHLRFYFLSSVAIPSASISKLSSDQTLPALCAPHLSNYDACFFISYNRVLFKLTVD